MLTKSFTFRNIFILSVLFRLIAVVFSKGFAFQDDHFETIEIAYKWLHHLPFTQNGEVYIFNLLYVGLHYILLWGCEFLHILDPQKQMIVVRFFHAAFSLLTVYYGYKIALLLTKKNTTNESGFLKNKTPEIVAFILGLFWIFPFMSVRSLREFFSIPFLVIGFYLVVKHQNKKQEVNTNRYSISPILFAAFFMALAFIIRLQTIFFPAGIVLYFFYKKKWKLGFLFGLFFLLILSCTQFLFDYCYWGNPFASLIAYVKYNAVNYKDYPNGAWYKYILTIAGLLLFPSSILFVVGYFKNIKDKLILFLPSFLFIAFHSYFPNKQERFILTFFPFLIILGVLGFADIYASNIHKKWFKVFYKVCIAWFIAINSIGLIVVSFAYSKKSRIESMVYLSKKNDFKNVIIEGNEGMQLAPIFYFGKPLNYFEISPDNSFEQFKHQLEISSKPKPNYIIFQGANNLEARVAQIKILYPTIKEEAILQSSFVDNIAYYLNPKHNVNESWFIFKL